MAKVVYDIADINIIKKFTRKKIVKGFTTNPTLMRKAGAKNYTEYCKKIMDTKPIADNTNKITLKIIYDFLRRK